MAQRIRFKLSHSSGAAFYWTIYREPRTTQGPLWMLRTHDGAERGLERTWLDSVPLVRLIAENHGCTCNLS